MGKGTEERTKETEEAKGELVRFMANTRLFPPSSSSDVSLL